MPYFAMGQISDCHWPVQNCILGIRPEDRMFSSLHRDSNSKQFLTFVVSLCLQAAVLLAVGGQRYSQMSGPSIRHEGAHAAVTPIYFQHDAPASASDPEPAPAAAPPVREVASKTQADQDAEQASNAGPEASADDASGDSNGQGLAPFASWSMNSKSSGFTMFHHQFKNALPVFTPDPPILHTNAPELARGKDVVLEILIDDQGSIVQAKVLQGIGYGVEMSIVQTLRQWIFVPAKVNGMPISSHQQVRFHFPG